MSLNYALFLILLLSVIPLSHLHCLSMILWREEAILGLPHDQLENEKLRLFFHSLNIVFLICTVPSPSFSFVVDIPIIA